MKSTDGDGHLFAFLIIEKGLRLNTVKFFLSWNSITLATWCEVPTHWKIPDAGKDWWQEKGVAEDEMNGWHHWLNRHEFEQTPENSEQGSLVYCSSWNHKESDTA